MSTCNSIISFYINFFQVNWIPIMTKHDQSFIKRFIIKGLSTGCRSFGNGFSLSIVTPFISLVADSFSFALVVDVGVPAADNDYITGLVIRINDLLQLANFFPDGAICRLETVNILYHIYMKHTVYVILHLDYFISSKVLIFKILLKFRLIQRNRLQNM